MTLGSGKRVKTVLGRPTLGGLSGIVLIGAVLD